MMNPLPDAAPAPAHEALVEAARLAKTFGQVLPWCAGACDPEDGIDEEAVVLGVAPELAGLSGQQGPDAVEVVVGDGVAVHGRRRSDEKEAAPNAAPIPRVPRP